MYLWNQFSDITAITSTRNDGFSKEGYSSLNLALHVGDDEPIVLKNREKFFSDSAVNINRSNAVFVAQFHSDITKKITRNNVGRGYRKFEDGIKADALYTKEKGIGLAIYHADCVPVFVFVPNHKIVGIIHAGEKGSVANITGKFMTKLFEEEGVKPEEVFAHIGPSLTFSYRVISKERAEELARLGGDIQKAVKATLPQYFLDLPLLNILQMRRLGVPLSNISLSEQCTYENNDLYFSYAVENKCGRNISFIRLD